MRSADIQGVKKLVFGSPSSDKKFKKLRVMNSLKYVPSKAVIRDLFFGYLLFCIPEYLAPLIWIFWA